MNIRYYLLPEDLQGTMARYIEDGIPPGGFMEAVLSNDLIGAFSKADHVNINRIESIVRWIYNEAPSNCWGSYDILHTWVNVGGLKGYGKLKRKEE